MTHARVSLTPPVHTVGHGCSLIVAPAHSHTSRQPIYFQSQASCACCVASQLKLLSHALVTSRCHAQNLGCTWRADAHSCDRSNHRLPIFTQRFSLPCAQGQVPKRALTAAELFSAHGPLYDVLLHHLHCACEAMEAAKAAAPPSLYPVLVLLSRLRCCLLTDNKHADAIECQCHWCDCLCCTTEGSAGSEMKERQWLNDTLSTMLDK